MTGISYSYAVATANANGRTLKGFSTDANVKMRHDEDVTKEFYPEFQKVNLTRLRFDQRSIQILSILLTIDSAVVASVL